MVYKKVASLAEKHEAEKKIVRLESQINLSKMKTPMDIIGKKAIRVGSTRGVQRESVAAFDYKIRFQTI